MLDLKYILSNLDEVKEKTKNRNYEFDFDTLVAENSKRKDIINEVEKLKADRNAISKQVGILKKEGKNTTELQEQVKRDASKMQELDAALNTCDENIKNMLLNLPNLIDDTTPVGKDEKDNVEVRKWGEPKKFDFEPKNHWDIGADLGIIDFERGVKIAESRFNVLAGLGARLDRAISSLMLDMHREKGYIEMSVPYLVNTKSMIGTGQLPKFAEEAYICERDNLYLISTAEIPVTNLYSDEILDNKDLPIYNTSLTACFRREAGSYGKDTKGLIRNHQFNKVELVKICSAETSVEEHEKLTHDAEMVLQALNLPYRVMALSSGDIGFSSAKTYDLEVWLPGQNCYREISSCSNFKDYQARRANIRYRDKDGKVKFAHTLNGSGLAVGRTLVAVLENYQNADGSVTIPEALRPYLGGLDIIKKG